MKKKEVKVGLSPINWILSILGILIFASFIILPPVFRVVFKEKVKEEIPEEKVIITKMVCTRNNHPVGNHSETNKIEITYHKDSLKTYKKHTTEYFKISTSFEEEKISKNNLTTAASLVEGIVYNLSKDDSNLTINIDEEFDLVVFKDDVVKLPETEEEVKVTCPYKLNDSATGIISALTTEGYTCTEDTNYAKED